MYLILQMLLKSGSNFWQLFGLVWTMVLFKNNPQWLNFGKIGLLSISSSVYTWGRCCGQVVSVLAYKSDDPSLNLADAYSFSVKFVLEKNKNKQKEVGLAHLRKHLYILWRQFILFGPWHVTHLGGPLGHSGLLTMAFPFNRCSGPGLLPLEQWL